MQRYCVRHQPKHKHTHSTHARKHTRTHASTHTHTTHTEPLAVHACVRCPVFRPEPCTVCRECNARGTITRRWLFELDAVDGSGVQPLVLAGDVAVRCCEEEEEEEVVVVVVFMLCWWNAMAVWHELRCVSHLLPRLLHTRKRFSDT